MKQYTTPEQTAKLIEQGLPQPRTKIPFEVANDELGYIYSIGELIEMLPKELEVHNWDFYSIGIYFDTFNWNVCYKNRRGQIAYQTSSIEELVNALYEMVVKLKEEGVI